MRLGTALGAAAAAAWFAVVPTGLAGAQAKATPMRPVDVTADNADQEVKKAKLPVYLLFPTPDCKPCGTQDAISNAVAGEFNGKIKLVRIDVEKSPGFARALRLNTLPTHFMFRDASEGPVEGLRDAAALRKFIADFLDRPAAPKTQ